MDNTVVKAEYECCPHSVSMPSCISVSSTRRMVPLPSCRGDRLNLQGLFLWLGLELELGSALCLKYA